MTAPAKPRKARAAPTQVQRDADILKLRDSLQRLHIEAFGGVVSKCSEDHREIASAIFVSYLIGAQDGLDGVSAPVHLRSWINELLIGFSQHHQELCKAGIQAEAARWN
jgi:hypothetical protein